MSYFLQKIPRYQNVQLAKKGKKSAMKNVCISRCFLEKNYFTPQVPVDLSVDQWIRKWAKNQQVVSSNLPGGNFFFALSLNTFWLFAGPQFSQTLKLFPFIFFLDCFFKNYVLPPPLFFHFFVFLFLHIALF